MIAFSVETRRSYEFRPRAEPNFGRFAP